MKKNDNAHKIITINKTQSDDTKNKTISATIYATTISI